jgi:hypothetical protein
VSHCGLDIYIKKDLKAFEELWKIQNISPCKNIIFRKILYKKNQNPSRCRKALPGCFLRIFSSLTCLEETCFQQEGSSAVEGSTSETLQGSSDQRKAQAGLSLFLKSEKNPALLRKKDLSTGPSSPIHNSI